MKNPALRCLERKLIILKKIPLLLSGKCWTFSKARLLLESEFDEPPLIWKKFDGAVLVVESNSWSVTWEPRAFDFFDDKPLLYWKTVCVALDKTQVSEPLFWDSCVGEVPASAKVN